MNGSSDFRVTLLGTGVPTPRVGEDLMSFDIGDTVTVRRHQP